MALLKTTSKFCLKKALDLQKQTKKRIAVVSSFSCLEKKKEKKTGVQISYQRSVINLVSIVNVSA